MKNLISALIVSSSFLSTLAYASDNEVSNKFTIMAYEESVSNGWKTCQGQAALEIKARAEKNCEENKAQVERNFDKLASELGIDRSSLQVNESVGCRIKAQPSRPGVATYSCELSVLVSDSNYTLMHSEFDTKGNKDKCLPMLELNEKNRNVVFQDITTSWSLLGRDRCQVPLYELIKK